MNPVRYVPRLRYLRRPLLVTVMVVVAGFVPSPASAMSRSPDIDPVQVTRRLNREVRTPGTAWGVDPATGHVVVSYDDTVTGTELTLLRSVTARFGDAVHIERNPGILRPLISGADPIYTGSGSRCTLGFNVRDTAGTIYFLTAGHCVAVSSTWYGAGGVYLGTAAGYRFPGDDYGRVRYGNASIPKPGNVNLHNGSYQDIVSAGNPDPSKPVCISGPGGGYRCGMIVQFNATVNYPQGTVYGLTKIAVCPVPGDSGGPAFQQTLAVGIVSGGSGSCPTGYTYYQPINEPLSVYGVSVY